MNYALSTVRRPIQSKGASKVFAKLFCPLGKLLETVFKKFSTKVLDCKRFISFTKFPFRIETLTWFEDELVQNDMKGNSDIKSIVVIWPSLNISRMAMLFMYLPT
jgi:hypothetical protein